MKIRHFICAAAMTVVAFASCQDNVALENPVQKQDTYTVKLACAGELDVTHVPLKSSSDDLYGIQVYYAPVSGGSYQNYAYGLFDDVSDVSLDLIADYKYKFVIDMIVNGKNVVYSSNMNTPEEQEILLGYGAPFKMYVKGKGSNLAPITNELILTSDSYFNRLGYDIQLLDGVEYYSPKGVDVYYGEQSDYVPTEDGATIVINMKHMIFGVKVIADINQGTVNGYISEASGISSSYYRDNFSLTAPSNLVHEATFAYTSDRSRWYRYDVQNDAYATMYVDFEWVKDENTTLKLDYQSIKVIRMKQTVVNVTFFEDESAGNTKVAMVFDDLEMSENETSYTFGDDQEEYEW